MTSELDDAVFRESIRTLERTQKLDTLRTGNKIPQYIIERRAVGSTQWRAFSLHHSKKKALNSKPEDNDHYEYRLRNGSHTPNRIRS